MKPARVVSGVTRDLSQGGQRLGAHWSPQRASQNSEKS